MARTPDRITLTGVRVHAHHGVYASERVEGQEFVIDVAVDVDFAAAASRDDLGSTVNYGELCAVAEPEPVACARVEGVEIEEPGVGAAEVTR